MQHHGILKVGLVALSATLAPHANAQPRPAQPPIAGRQVLTQSPAARAAVVPLLPNLVGLTADSATRLLTSMRLRTVRRDTSTNASPGNRVIGQQPSAGTPLRAIDAVTLTVALPTRAAGPRTPIMATVVDGVIIPPRSVSTTPPTGRPPSALVPQLFGRNWQSAIIAITEVRLRPDRSVETDFSDVVDSGFVFQQHPLPRTRVDTGSLVKIWISLGPHRQPPTVVTPDVVGRPLGVADQLLRGARLTVGHVDTVFRARAHGEVEHQLPEAGAAAHPGDAVALRLAMSPPLIPVPSVIGLQRADASVKLRQAGLALGQVTPVMMSGRDTVIVGQKPSAYTGVVKGTFVDVEENQPIVRRRTVVPNLGGMTSALATQRLTRDSLTLGSVVVSDNGDAPVVVVQRPAAGESVYFYDPVSITVASPRVALPPPTMPATTPTAPPTLAPRPAPAPPLTPAAAPPIPTAGTTAAGKTTTNTGPAETRGPTTPLVAVPLVTNMPFEGARRLIDSLGLSTVSTTASMGRNFVVRSQRPDAGSLVPFGAQVALTLEPIAVRSVPHLVGLKSTAAAEHASADGFTMSIQNRRRVLLTFFERVATQEPDLMTISRGDQRIEVDLATPLVPPVPAGVALVLAAAATAVKARSKRTRGSNGHPITDLHIELVLSPAPPPVPSPIPDDRVIRTAITFALDTDRGAWTVESDANSLVAHIHTHV
jgi:beta-lactam-binding protein with PASTA domain